MAERGNRLNHKDLEIKLRFLDDGLKETPPAIECFIMFREQ